MDDHVWPDPARIDFVLIHVAPGTPNLDVASPEVEMQLERLNPSWPNLRAKLVFSERFPLHATRVEMFTGKVTPAEAAPEVIRAYFANCTVRGFVNTDTGHGQFAIVRS